MNKTSGVIHWAGYPAAQEVLLNYVDRVRQELPHCRHIHYGFMPSGKHLHQSPAANFRFRLTWVFSGKLCTQAAFEKHWSKRFILAQELYLSGTGGWDVVDFPGGDCQVLAILFYSHHTRLVFSEFKAGRVITNPYYHTSLPDSEISRRLLELLNRLMNEPEAERHNRVLPLCQALLEQLWLDVQRDKLSPATSADLMVNNMLTYMQLCFHLPINCSSICAELKINRTYASELFHAKTGQTLKDYLLNLRLEKAEWLLRCYKLNLSEVAQQCGFSGTNYFVRIFKNRYGISPGKFRLHPPAAPNKP